MVDLEERGFRRMLRLKGRSMRNLRTNVHFTATVNHVGEFNLSTELSDDPRSDAVMELVLIGAPEIHSQDQVQNVKTGEKWNVVKQKFDCPHYAKKYELKQIVPGIDT